VFSKFYAKFVLAIQFFIHLFGRIFLFWRKRKGLDQFLSQYAADAIYPITPGERKLFPSYQRCQVCSLCTFSCVAIQLGKAPSDFEPKFLMLGYGRSPHESEVFLDEWMPCYECKSCTILCPNDVPIHTMAKQIKKRRERLGFRKGR